MEETSEILIDSSGSSLAEDHLARRLVAFSLKPYNREESDRKREFYDCLYQSDLNRADQECIKTIDIGSDGNLIDEGEKGIQILIKEVMERMMRCGVECKYIPRFILWRGSVHLVSPKGDLLLIDWFSNWTKDPTFHQAIEETLEWQDLDLSHSTTPFEMRLEDVNQKPRARRMVSLLSY